jgi:hypothetical protein
VRHRQGPLWAVFSPPWPWWAPGGTSHQVGWSGEARGPRGGATGGAALAFAFAPAWPGRGGTPTYGGEPKTPRIWAFLVKPFLNRSVELKTGALMAQSENVRSSTGGMPLHPPRRLAAVRSPAGAWRAGVWLMKAAAAVFL